MAQEEHLYNEINAVNKLGLLANLFSQPGDLVLTEIDKSGLVDIFQEMVIILSPP
jgi:hypothetical protein